jgi:hypothetical protein
MSIPRSLLVQAFPDNPRLRNQMEAVLNLVDSIGTQATELQTQLNTIASELGAGEFQPLSAMLSELAALPNKAGAVELTNAGSATVRSIDGADPASLLSRGQFYTLGLVIGGKGITSARPTVPATGAAIYFDTTLAAGGKPIFNYHGAGWVDATGASV